MSRKSNQEAIKQMIAAPAPKVWYIPMKVRKWEDLTAGGVIPIRIEGAGFGYIAVFDNLQELEKEYPGVPFQMITQASHEEEDAGAKGRAN